MKGSATRLVTPVNTSSTAGWTRLKYRSTRYLSKCVEMAHKTGPENAKKTQEADIEQKTAGEGAKRMDAAILYTIITLASGARVWELLSGFAMVLHPRSGTTSAISSPPEIGL